MSTNKLNIIFAGTPPFAAEVLQALTKEHHIVAVYTQPDRPAGRGRKLAPSAVKQVALKHHYPIYQPTSLRDADAQQQLAKFNADVMVVVAYGLLLPRAVLDTPQYGCLNVHASLLPRWRGAAPIQRAIAAGDKKTGITIMQMDEGLDTGDMLLSKNCDIADNDTAQSVHDKLALLGGEALLEVLASIDNLHPQKQNDTDSNYAKKLQKTEGKIDWQQNATSIERHIRAFYPWPGTYTSLNEGNLKIQQAEVVRQDHQQKPGTVITINKNGIDVACGHHILRITHCQLPGKKPMTVNALINANNFPLHVGMQL